MNADAIYVPALDCGMETHIQCEEDGTGRMIGDEMWKRQSVPSRRRVMMKPAHGTEAWRKVG